MQSLINTGLTPRSAHSSHSHAQRITRNAPLITHVYLPAACTALHYHHYVLSPSHMCTSGPSPVSVIDCLAQYHRVSALCWREYMGGGGGCTRTCVCRGSRPLFFLHACHSPMKQLKFLPCQQPAAVARSDCDRHTCVLVNMHEAVFNPHQLQWAHAHTHSPPLAFSSISLIMSHDSSTWCE